MKAMFQYCLNPIIGFDYWNTSNVLDMSKMFKDSLNPGQDSVSRWNTSQVLTISEIFMRTSNVTFYYAPSGSSRWDVSNVRDFSRAFWRNNNAQTFTAYDHEQASTYYESWQHWDVSNGTNFNEMFRFAQGVPLAYAGASGITVSYTGWCTTNVEQIYNFTPGHTSYGLTIIPPNWGDCPAPIPTQTPFSTPSPTPTNTQTPTNTVTPTNSSYIIRICPKHKPRIFCCSSIIKICVCSIFITIYR